MDLKQILSLAEIGDRFRRPTNLGPWYRIKNEEDGRTPVYMYGEIGWDVPASDFVKEMKSIKTPVDLHINSGGGSVFDGLAIYAALKNHEPGVKVVVDSLAASAASFIAMSGTEITMEKPSKMFIHDAQGIVVGNSADMMDMAEVLDTISDTIAEIYADRAGGKTETWRAAMRKETWYTANQAIEAGLADSVVGEAPESDSTASNHRRGQLIRARARVTLRG